MGSNVSIDTDALHIATKLLRAEARSLLADNLGGFRPGLAGYSQASGFREAGRSLGKVSSFHAPEAFRVMAAQLNDTAHAAEVNLANMERTDGTLAGAFRSIEAGGQHALGGATGSLQPAHLPAHAASTPITALPPVAVAPPNLRLLERLMSTSRVSAASSEAAYWGHVAGRLDAAVHSLFGVRQKLATSLDTAWVRRADERVNKIQRAASMYAMRARAMSAHNTSLATTTSAETALAAAAAAVAAALPLHIRPVYEATFLSAFGPRASASLTTTVPAFSKLYPDLDRISGNPFRIGEMPQPAAPSFERSPLPEMVRDSFVAIGHADLAHAVTPDDVVHAYGQVTPDVVEAIRAGATQTQVASAASPTMPPSLHPGLNSGAAALRVSGIGTAAAGVVSSAASAGLALPALAAPRAHNAPGQRAPSALSPAGAAGNPSAAVATHGGQTAAPPAVAGAPGTAGARTKALPAPALLGGGAAGPLPAGFGPAVPGAPGRVVAHTDALSRGARTAGALGRSADAAAQLANIASAPANAVGFGGGAVPRPNGVNRSGAVPAGAGAHVGELGVHAAPGSASGAAAPMGSMGVPGAPGGGAGATPHGTHGTYGGAGTAGSAAGGAHAAGANGGIRPVIAGGAPVAGGRA
ncbi:hypothetical protein V6D40_07860, partial [Corynebacterium sp. Q4381]